MKLTSANSSLLTQAEIRLSTIMRECTAIKYTLTEYKNLTLDQNTHQLFLLIVSPLSFSLTKI